MGVVQVTVTNYKWVKDLLLQCISNRVVARTAQGALQSVKAWYRRLPADWFDGPNHPSGGARSFMQPLSSAWYAEDDADGFSLCFKHDRSGGSPWGLRLHQYGGVIRPKNKLALTIPIDARAHGLRAETFSEKVHRLFVIANPKGSESVGVLAFEDDAGEVHAAYALRRQTRVESLRKRRGHDAIPSEDELIDMTRPYFEAALAEALKTK